MLIKRNILFFVQSSTSENQKEENHIRMKIRWREGVVTFNVGYTINPEKWSKETQRCKKGAMNKKRFTSTEINKEIQRLENIAESVFKHFEETEKVPDKQEFKNEFNRLNGKLNKIIDTKSFKSVLLEFCSDQGSLNGWSDSTYRKFKTLYNHLIEFNPDIKLSDFTEDTLTKFVSFCIETKDFQNTTTLKNVKLLKWFLKWAHRKKYLECNDFDLFSPKLKTVSDKEVVFLSWAELMKLYNMKFPPNKLYLERARDVFCFQCFTSLRYSDVDNLKKEDIKENHFTIVAIKTGSTLTIDLNDYSRSILDKYKESVFDNNRALPVISNQTYNDYLKELCFIAGINEPIKTAYYKGGKRIEEIKPKYDLISSHTGRRTFICNALLMGILPITVMEWTGHSDYKAMKPYIAIADEERKKAMTLFNKK